MPIRCAWCGAPLGDDARLPDVSHGICSACERVNFPKPADPAGVATRDHQSSPHPSS
jgi:hypothetical protein